MTTTFIIQSIFEVAAAVLIVVGFIFEDKVIAFEDRIWAKIKEVFKK